MESTPGDRTLGLGPGLSASRAGGLPAQGRFQDFSGMGWTLNHSNSNLDGGTTRGGGSVLSFLGVEHVGRS